MTSFSSEGGADGARGARGAQRTNGCSIFIGSFNINSQDLTIEDARAWLKEAKHADIVALGLQECATVPAKPFPEPTNGKAIAMWKEVKDVAVPEAAHSGGYGTNGSGENGRKDGKGSPALAGIVQSVVSEMLGAARKAKQARAGDSSNRKATAEGVQLACGGTCSSSNSSNSSNSSRCGGISTIESSTPVMLGDTKRGDLDGNSSIGSEGMRQESYYLRGPIEPERDEKLLNTIAACIPGERSVT